MWRNEVAPCAELERARAVVGASAQHGLHPRVPTIRASFERPY